MYNKMTNLVYCLFIERQATQLGMNKSVLDKLVKFGDSDSNMLLKGLFYILSALDF